MKRQNTYQKPTLNFKAQDAFYYKIQYEFGSMGTKKTIQFVCCVVNDVLYIG